MCSPASEYNRQLYYKKGSKVKKMPTDKGFSHLNNRGF
jgi:hypothetical protein